MRWTVHLSVLSSNFAGIFAKTFVSASFKDSLSPITVASRLHPPGSRARKTTRGTEENYMRKLSSCLSCILFASALLFTEAASAADQTKDDDRLRNSGTVLKEILDVPVGIPQELLDKADCVVVFPSVLKAAFIVGGSYGRGAMSCRKGENFTGPCGAPTMIALEGGRFGFQTGGQATDFHSRMLHEPSATAH